MTPQSLSGLDRRDIAEVLAASERFAERLRVARVVVTGATGWFGTWLLDALVALDAAHRLGLRIVAVSRDPARFAARHPALHAAPIVEWVAADVRSAIDVHGPVTHVIHAATEASAHLNESDPDRMFETIFGGTRHALALAARHPGCRVLLLGSGAVYGVQPAGVARLDEDHPGAPDVLDPGSAYAEGKRAAEQIAAIWHAKRDVPVLLARCFAFVGPHMPFDAHFAIGNFIRDAVDGREIRITGDGRPKRSYLYLTDLVVWLLAVLVEGRPMRPYNVGAEESVSIGAVARLCAGRTDAPVSVRIDGTDRPGRDYVPDVGRIRRELGVTITVPLAEAIARTVAWKMRLAAPVPA